MSVKSIIKLVFCACTGLLFLASVTQGLSCYECAFFQDSAERCQCRLNPSQDKKICKDFVKFPKSDRRQSENNDEKDSQDPRKYVDTCLINLKIDGFHPGSVELYRRSSQADPKRSNITSKCNLDATLLTPANESLVCHCDTDWCNGQPFDFPDFKPTTTTKLPCPTTTTTTPTTTRKTTTTPGTSTTPCVPNPPTSTTPQSVTSSSSAFNHRDDYFTLHKYWILCRTIILLIGSLLLHSVVGHV